MSQESWNIWHPIKKKHQLSIYEPESEKFRFSSGYKISKSNVNFCSPTERKNFENWLKKQK